MKRRIKSISYVLPFVASILVLRLQFITDLHLRASQAIGLGIPLGFLYDFAITLLPLAVAWILLGVFKIPYVLTWTAGALLVWLSVLANTIYYRFFKSMLDWWVLRLHWHDLFFVGGSTKSLATSWPIVASIIFFTIALLVCWILRGPRFWKLSRSTDRSKALATGISLLLFALLLRQSPVWFNIVNFNSQDTGKGSVFNTQILMYWWTQWFQNEAQASSHSLSFLKGSTSTDSVARKLVEFSNFSLSQKTLYQAPRDKSWPLLRELRIDPRATEAMRKHLGLPVDRPLNVVVLFLESIRAFELYHPVLGPEIFPGLRSVLSHNGIVFEQAYSSAIEAGQTVRGQFSSLCSMFPNVGGPAPYIAFPTIRIECLQESLRQQGYRTVWMNSFERKFHNKEAFEIVHGTELFFDREYFQKRGIHEKIGDWGLADKPVLQEVLQTIKELDGQGKPVFANVLTISSHHPPRLVPGIELTPELEKSVARLKDYRAQLTQFKYVDAAVTEFFKRLFESSLANHTVVILLGDHSTGLPPHLPLSAVQNAELQSRIPLAIITKNLPSPTVIRYPVHQMDIAPTVASIIGIPGKVTWIGRNILSGPGTPWLYETSNAIFYRTAERGCYTDPGENKLHCYSLSQNVDPLFQGSLKEIPENTADTSFFREVLSAQKEAIQNDMISPSSEASP